jgi:hypothetical protein
VYAKLASGIGTGGHHASAIRTATHCKGFALQFRISQFFDSAEKGVEIEMEDFAGHGGS